MTFARAVESRSERHKAQTPRRPRRRLRAPWQPLAILAAVAGSLWFAAEPYPNLRSANGALAMNGSGVFALCVGASERNCVIDGDTIRYGGTKIRLEDIDAPEVFSPSCASEAARGRRATRRLLELINAGPFQLVRLTLRGASGHFARARLALGGHRPARPDAVTPACRGRGQRSGLRLRGARLQGGDVPRGAWPGRSTWRGPSLKGGWRRRGPGRSGTRFTPLGSPARGATLTRP
jgi:endonuclease YncB( thermonuclease family)